MPGLWRTRRSSAFRAARKCARRASCGSPQMGRRSITSGARRAIRKPRARWNSRTARRRRPCNISAAKEPVQQDFKFSSARIAVLDNNLYEQYAVLGTNLRLERQGKTKLPCPDPARRNSREYRCGVSGSRRVSTAQICKLLRVHSTDLEIQLYLRREVPSRPPGGSGGESSDRPAVTAVKQQSCAVCEKIIWNLVKTAFAMVIRASRFI